MDKQKEYYFDELVRATSTMNAFHYKLMDLNNRARMCKKRYEEAQADVERWKKLYTEATK